VAEAVLLSEDELQVLSSGSNQNSISPLTMENSRLVAGEPVVTMHRTLALSSSR
jgi:hypothetical protein